MVGERFGVTVWSDDERPRRDRLWRGGLGWDMHNIGRVATCGPPATTLFIHASSATRIVGRRGWEKPAFTCDARKGGGWGETDNTSTSCSPHTTATNQGHGLVACERNNNTAPPVSATANGAMERGRRLS